MGMVMRTSIARFAARLVTGALASVSAVFASAMAAPALAGSIPPAVNEGKQWKLVKTEWSAADEAGYEAFVQAIGRSNCNTLGNCLAGKANPYRHTDTRRYSGDCADMAYILRAYYAWKNGLPFSYQSAMRTADGSRDDLRYSRAGNIVAARRDAIGDAGPISAPGFIARIGGEVSTAMFRTHPEKGGGRRHDDFYPVSITRDGVRPGAIAYDIFGHVGIVYDILEDGRVMIVASHPDNSVTRTVYGPNFLRASPALGAGLKGWRPIRLVGATKTDSGYMGGKIKALANDAIATFSTEQYMGNQPHPSGRWEYAEYRVGERTVTFYDFVRRRLASPDFAYNPVTELRHGMKALCSDIKSRRAAVKRASDARIHLKPHPVRLPPNIYGTYGEWEHYSTPSRDARLKVGFIELLRTTKGFYERSRLGDASVRYDGADLPGDLWRAFNAEKDACTITYSRSDGLHRVQLNLGHVMDRLWDLSFDPYHCPERRWGARGAELETCTDNAEKTRWYAAQRFLRNQAQRTYDVRMDFTVDELKPPMLAAPEQGGLGVEAPADADLRQYLADLNAVGLAGAPSDPEGAPLIEAAFPEPAADGRGTIFGPNP